MSAAGKISRARGRRSARSGRWSRHYQVSSAARAGRPRERRSAVRVARRIAVRHTFPLDGEYVLRVRLQATLVASIRGLDEPQQVDVRLDGAASSSSRWRGPERTPAASSGLARGSLAERGCEPGRPLSRKAGMRTVAVSFLSRGHWRSKASVPARSRRSANIQPARRQARPALRDRSGVDSVQIGGPYNAPGRGHASRRGIFVCRPSQQRADETAVRQEDSRHARPSRVSPAGHRRRRQHAARLLPKRVETRGLRRGHSAGARADAGRPASSCSASNATRRTWRRRRPTGSAMSSWRRGCRSSSGAAFRTTSCSTWPRAAKLKDPAVLEQQVRRMLADPRVDGARHQFRRPVAAPAQHAGGDAGCRTRFPSSTTTCARRSSARPSCFSRASCARIAACVDLLTANYTFVNERLARHYGIPNVYGSHFRRVTFDGRERGRPARAGQHPDGHVVCNADLAGGARQVAAREHSRRAAAAAAAERAGADGEAMRRGKPRFGARADGAAPEESGLRELATRRWTRSASRSRTSTRSGSGGHRARPSTPIDASGDPARRHEVRGPGGAAERVAVRAAENS